MTQDLSAEAEEIVDELVAGMVKQKEEIDKAIPRPFGQTDVPFETRLETLHKGINPLVLDAYRTVFGRRMLVEELLKDDLLQTYLERVKQNGAQTIDVPSLEGGEAAVGPEGRDGAVDTGAGDEGLRRQAPAGGEVEGELS